MADAGSITYTIDANTSSLLRAERSVDKSVKNIVGSLSRIAGGVSIGLLVNQLIKVQREFDKLNAAVLTSTGSVEKAGVAFKALERFAAETPFALEQSVTAFTKLVNFGLTPSERALRSFGDTSAALGKDLEQMIEAVADAATGEFERLKEFGIKSKNQGDTIAFTFRGMTTTVKNSAADIEEFLIKLGENNFAGAMANRMATLDGAISNMEDSWAGLLRTVSAQGPGTIINETVRTATAAIQELITLLQSGQLSGVMDTIANAWRRSFSDIGAMVSNLTTFILGEFKAIESEGRSVPELISDAFFNFPANIKAAIQIATVEIAAFVDKAKAFAKQINIDLNPFSGGVGTLEADLKQIDTVLKSTTTSILKTRDQSIKKTNEEREAVTRLRLEFDKKTKAEKEATEGTDVLAQFKVVVPEVADPLDGITESIQNATLSWEEFGDTSTDVIAGMLSGTMSATQAMQNFAGVILNNAVGALVDMGIETIKAQFLSEGLEKSKQAGIVTTAAVSKAATVASTATQVTAAGTVAAAAAPAAALTSTFSFGQAALIGGAAVLGTLALVKAGSREHGGPVSAGKSFLVGERGPEMFTPNNSGRVSSNKDTFGGGNFEQSVTIVNNTPANVSTQTSDDGKQLKILINEVANQISTNQGPIPRAMRNSTNTTFRTSR